MKSTGFSLTCDQNQQNNTVKVLGLSIHHRFLFFKNTSISDGLKEDVFPVYQSNSLYQCASYKQVLTEPNMWSEPENIFKIII